MSYSEYRDASLATADDSLNGVAAPNRRPRQEGHRTDVTAVFSMRAARFKPALFKLVCGALAGGLGAFLISEIPNTPDLTLNLAIIGGIGLTSALVLVVLAVREFTGRLVVDCDGLRFLPSWAGPQVSWADITGWQMTEEDDLPSELQQLKLWRAEESFPVIVETGWMTVDSRGTLRKVLRQIAGQDRPS